jgi:hypothetical protein
VKLLIFGGCGLGFGGNKIDARMSILVVFYGY